jgi:hypothetical protein
MPHTRRKGRQDITVRHLHVHAGGQAVVGRFGHQRGRGLTKNDQRPYERGQEKRATSAIPESQSVRSADQAGHALSITSDEEGPLIERTVDFLRGSAHQIGSYLGVEQVKLALKAIWPCTASRPGVGVTINPAAGPSIYFGLDPSGRPVAKIR